jgi:alkylation response protein AidB-like acyl-CoA dehydrogenase
MANSTLSPDLAIRHHSATMTLALMRARQAVKDAIRRKGEKVSSFAACEITAMAKAYLAEHHELIAEAKATFERWTL